MNAAQRKKARKAKQLIEAGRRAHEYAETAQALADNAVADAEERATAAAAQLEQAEADFREVARQRDQAERDANTLRATLKDVRADLAATRHQLEVVEAARDCAARDRDHYQRENLLFHAEVKDLRAQDHDAAHLRRRLKARGEELDAMRDRVNRLETQLARLQREHAAALIVGPRPVVDKAGEVVGYVQPASGPGVP